MIVDVPALNVRLVAVVKVSGVALVKVSADAFNDIDLTFELLDDNPPVLKA